jgi:shikimate kinase
MKTNIVLVGLMGSGKTTVGRILSRMLKMDFIDSDEDIERNYGPIKNLFEKSEEHFRNIESMRIKMISQKSNTVISTGGGVVLRPENMEALRENGIVFYLDRPVDQIVASIDTSERPLLKDGAEALFRLQKERSGLYLKYSDYVIKCPDMELAASEIASVYNYNKQS